MVYCEFVYTLITGDVENGIDRRVTVSSLRTLIYYEFDWGVD